VLGSDTGSNFFEIGGSYSNRRVGTTNWNEVYPRAEGGDRSAIDRSIGTSTYVYARLDFQNAWKSNQHLTRAYRSFDHLKGPADYVVVFDNVASILPGQKRTRIHYHKYGDASATLTGGGTASMVFKKPTQGAMVATQLLFPGGGSPTITDSSSANANTETIDWGYVNIAQMIAVHRVSGNVADVPGSITLAPADPNSIAVQIDDPAQSWELVYSKDGELHRAWAFTTTYAGNGKVLMHGLSPGSYRVFQDGSMILSQQPVGSDGTLLFTANGPHTFHVTREFR
jgi:hypothetical protein